VVDVNPLPESSDFCVKYAIGNEKKRYVQMVSREMTFGGFIQLIKEKRKAPDLSSAYMDGGLLDNEDPVCEWFSPEYIFRVTNSDQEAPVVDESDGDEWL
jgi:hypothetical protein